VKFERGVVLILRLCGDLTAVTNPLKLIFEPVSCGVPCLIRVFDRDLACPDPA